MLPSGALFMVDSLPLKWEYITQWELDRNEENRRGDKIQSKQERKRKRETQRHDERDSLARGKDE